MYVQSKLAPLGENLMKIGPVDPEIDIQEIIKNKLHRLTERDSIGSHTILYYFGVWGYFLGI